MSQDRVSIHDWDIEDWWKQICTIEEQQRLFQLHGYRCIPLVAGNGERQDEQ